MDRARCCCPAWGVVPGPTPTPSLPRALPAELAWGSQGAAEASPLRPSQVLLRSSSPAPAEPVDASRGLRALTQEEVKDMGVWPQGGAVSLRVLGPSPGVGGPGLPKEASRGRGEQEPPVQAVGAKAQRQGAG